MSSVRIDRDGAIWAVTIDRPEVRNAVDGPTARALADAFRAFDADADGTRRRPHGRRRSFLRRRRPAHRRRAARRPASSARPPNELALGLDDDMDRDGPMGPTRLELAKPVIAAVEGYAVAGGLELALWCDLRVAAATATFGVFCRRFGVPLIDGGTVRLPRLIGESRAMDLILTGRAVGADEALALGLANRVVAPARRLPPALQLARADRRVSRGMPAQRPAKRAAPARAAARATRWPGIRARPSDARLRRGRRRCPPLRFGRRPSTGDSRRPEAVPATARGGAVAALRACPKTASREER